MEKATIQTPATKGISQEFTAEEIPLPPKELWKELDNSGKAEPKPEGAVAVVKKREIAELDFGGKQRTEVKLEFPFLHPELGMIDKITVRRLSVGEVGALLENLPKDEPDNFWIYSKMTGVPAPVLRGLIDIDGEEVTNICYDFLPRVFRPRSTASSSPQPTGDM